MQNFKQFLLKEDTTIQDKSYFSIQFILTSNQDSNLEYTEFVKVDNFIKNKLQKEYPEIYKDLLDFDYLFSVKILSFNIAITKNNGNKLNEIIFKLSELAEEFFNSKDFSVQSSATLFNIEQQDFLIKCDDIKLSFDRQKEGSLKGIHKKIDCVSLKIWNIDNVEEGGLGLLQIKRLKTLLNIRINTEWFSIIEKHFKSDKDILECQEELIANGLNKYAKL